uniref:Polycystin cation channel PKD1/PKD2 domain-containing protein n=1 Tax=Neobodo designis TaxID=312471 RepID=A0A7S1PZN7_NEODS
MPRTNPAASEPLLSRQETTDTQRSAHHRQHTTTALTRQETTDTSRSALLQSPQRTEDGALGGRSSQPTRTSLFDVGRNLTATFEPVEVPAEEAVLLNPIEKFLRYRIFPWKLIIHSVILILLLTVTFVHQTEQGAYNLNARFGMARSFFNMQDNTDPSLISTFSNVDDAVAFIQQIGKAYDAMPDESSGVFMHYVLGPDDPTPVPPRLSLRLIKDPEKRRASPLPSSTLTEYVATNLTQDNHFKGSFFEYPDKIVGDERGCRPTDGYIPCRNASLPELFDRLVSGEIDMVMRSVRFYQDGGGASIARWRIKFLINFDDHGSAVRIRAKFEMDITEDPQLVVVVIVSLLVPLVLVHFLLRLRAFQRYHVYMKQLLPRWAQLETNERRRHRERHAGTSWKQFAILVDVFCMLFIVLAFTDSYVAMANMYVQLWKKLALGFAVAGYCLLYVSYLQTSPEFYVLIKTISMTVPAGIRYSAGVTPVFLGYAMAGTVVFGPWAQDTFGDFQLSCCTLFCVLNGDSLLQLSTEINQSDFWLLRQASRVFMFTFLAYFYNNAMNVMLAVVQDSYTQVRAMFEMSEWDMDKCNEELDLYHLSAAERHRRKRENRARRHQRTHARFGEYETGSTTDDVSSTTSTSSSDFSALGRGEITPKGLRKLADRIQRLQPS